MHYHYNNFHFWTVSEAMDNDVLWCQKSCLNVDSWYFQYIASQNTYPVIQISWVKVCSVSIRVSFILRFLPLLGNWILLIIFYRISVSFYFNSRLKIFRVEMLGKKNTPPLIIPLHVLSTVECKWNVSMFENLGLILIIISGVVL